MEICGWKVICEPFVDGPERWYATRPAEEIRLAASTLEELIGQIWAIEVGARAAW